jgi:hypothetical protein
MVQYVMFINECIMKGVTFMSSQSTLGIPNRHIIALKQGDLSKGLAVKECTDAANAVLSALQTEVHPGNVTMS